MGSLIGKLLSILGRVSAVICFYLLSRRKYGEYPELIPILERLVNKYRDVRYSEWKRLVEKGERFNDYSEDEPDTKLFWQAHTNVLEFEANESGNYAHISISIYPANVHSSPPAPGAGMLVYEAGWCDIGTPERDYIYYQNTGEGRKAT